jgi:hypothetical protein
MWTSFQSYSCETCFMSTFFLALKSGLWKILINHGLLPLLMFMKHHEKPWWIFMKNHGLLPLLMFMKNHDWYFHISSDVPSRDVENPHNLCWIPRIPMINLLAS